MAVVLAAQGSTSAASILLPNGEPDPNCPELRLWLRADSGIQDTVGRGPEDPNFNGMVAAWKDRSPQKFDLGASPAQSPFYVQAQPAAGNRPTVAFSNAQVLMRTGTVLHDRPGSTVIFVVQGQPSHSNCIYSAGKAPGASERFALCYSPVPFFYGGHSSGGLDGHFLDSGGQRGYGLDFGVPGDGRTRSRFLAIISTGETDRRWLEAQSGMIDLVRMKRTMAMAGQAPLASNKCGHEFYLGGSDRDFFGGQIAEAIVFNRGLSPVERADLLAYLRRRYELDRTEAILPDTFVVNAEDFDGNWAMDASRYQHFGTFLGNRHINAEGKRAEEGTKSTIRVRRDGTYHVWVRAGENQGGLRTIVQGKELRVTHVRGPGDVTWRDAGEVELKAGLAEILVRGEGPGTRNCYAVLISPTAAAIDNVEEILALAYRLRCVGGESHLTALFEHGQRLDGSLVTGWRFQDLSGRDASADPPGSPALTCIQFDSREEKPVAEFNSVVELQNGDRLRGTVGGYVPATSQAGKTAPARLLVRPPQGFFEKREQAFAVDTDWVRRIVFEASPRDRRCPPQTLICRDGRTYAFQAIRWSEQSLSLLTDDGVKRLTLNEVAEVRMPMVDAWESYYRELAVIDPEGNAGIVRVETSEGMTLTASTIRSSQVRDGNMCVTRIRMLQPVWNREPIPVAWANTRLLWRAPAQIVPLSRFTPDQVNQRGTLGSSWKWQTDRSVAGGNLASGGLEYLWGFGVHASNEMFFQLPDCVRALRTSVGIDSAVGNSGCVTAKVYANQATGEPLYESKPLIGATGAISTGEIVFPPASGGKRQLVLVAESAGDLRPEKGDPLDIGNHLDWLEPVLLLDPAGLRAEVDKRRPAAAP